MDEKEIPERLAYFQRIASVYGYHTVPTATIYQSFKDLVQPTKLGFEIIRRGLFGRVVNKDLLHLLKLQAIKGASYSVWWGVSLSYMPHEWGSRLRWHRSIKSSRFDLFEIPGNSPGNWYENESCLVDSCHGQAYFMETLDAMWDRLSLGIQDWFSSVRSLQNVAEKAHEQTKRKWASAHHHPDPLLVYAFSLARMRCREEAMTALDEYFKIRSESAEAQESLNKALQKISPN